MQTGLIFYKNKCLSGFGAVTGIKGDKETEYRCGNVNLTPNDIGAVTSDELISHKKTEAITTTGNTHPVGHVMVYDTTKDEVATNQPEVPSLYLFQDEIYKLNSNSSKHLPLSGGIITGNISTNGGAIFATDGNVYVNSNGYKDWLTNILNSKLSISASCNKNWNWDGSKGNQPTWLWGGETPNDVYVYNPSNFSVNYANTAGSAATASKLSVANCIIDGGGNDAAYGVGGALNNLAIRSWYGVSFTTNCSGQPYTGKNAFSIDCRNGFAYAHVMFVDEYIRMDNNKLIKCKLADGTTYNLIGLNSANNYHIGDTNNTVSGMYIHTRGKQYNFTDAAFCPNVTNNVSLGLSSKLWTTVYAKTGSINTSDRTKKHDIKGLTEVYEKLFLKLQPKSFIFNDGDRVHIGAISQDVEDVMQELGIEPDQFAGFCKDIRYEYTEYNDEDGTPVESSKVPCKDEDGNIIYDYALRYQEFIFLTVHMVQKLWNRVETLEKENIEMRDQIKDLENRMKLLESKISA